MLSKNIKRKLELMIEQAVVYAQVEHNAEPEQIERGIRKSVIANNKEALEYCIAHMRKITA
jgi:hypothetical protein